MTSVPPRAMPPQYVAPSAPSAPRTVTPPQVTPPHVTPPHVMRPQATPPHPRTQPHVVDEPAASLPRSMRRPWPLIIAVLVLDVGLAAAGAWLLAQGLRHPTASPPIAPSASKAP
ncbi:MAG TPA: hypothetical protein VFP84_26525 [Kofleriaceae bacterium]|nr:hypothetical protein [Kofleriaceae bacterium]